MFDEIIKHIRSYYQSDDGFISLHQPTFIGNEKKYVVDCIDSNFVSSVGKYVDSFEKSFADYIGAKYAIAIVNGSSALHMALKVADVKAGDLVVTQPLTFIATCNAISYTGASPVFVDVDRTSMGLSAEAFAQFLKSHTHQVAGQCYHKKTGRRIRACVPMHTFGHACQIESIQELCLSHNIVLVEDSAESVGSSVNGMRTGTFGRLSCFSFNGNKTITAGGGGAIVTNDEKLARACKHITTQAKVPHQWAFIHDEIGYNYRMPNLNAALLLAQLEQADKLIAEKRNLAERYKQFFADTPIQFMAEPANTISNYWLCAVLFPDHAQQQSFLQYSNDRKVMTRPVWELMTSLNMYKDCPQDVIPNATFLAQRLVNLPSTPNMPRPTLLNDL